MYATPPDDGTDEVWVPHIHDSKDRVYIICTFVCETEIFHASKPYSIFEIPYGYDPLLPDLLLYIDYKLPIKHNPP